MFLQIFIEITRGPLSLISVIIIPEVWKAFELVKILSMRVADFDMILVGLVILGYIEWDVRILTKSLVRQWVSSFSKLMLSRPLATQAFEFLGSSKLTWSQRCSALMQFSVGRPQLDAPTRSHLKNLLHVKEFKSPKKFLKIVGSCWHTKITKVKGQIFSVCCVFAAKRLKWWQRTTVYLQ